MVALGCFLWLTASHLLAQNCQPDSSFQLTGIYPDTLTPVCKHSPTLRSLTLVRQKDSLSNGVYLDIDSIELVSIQNLPGGLHFASQSPTSIFPKFASICLSIAGLPDTTGYFPTQIITKIYANSSTAPISLLDTFELKPWEAGPAIKTELLGVQDADCGVANGTIALYALGSYPPYNYSWDIGQSGSVAIQLPAGLHHVKITNAVGCYIIRQVNVETLGAGPVANIQYQNPTCAGADNGSIMVFPVVPSAAYTYTWNTGETTQNIQNLPPGEYHLAIEDANGCVSAYVTELKAPFPIALPFSAFPPQGGQANGSIILSPSGGSPPYEFSWSNGSTSDVLYNLSAGTYSCVVMDEQGCTATVSIDLYPVSIDPSLSGDFRLFPNPFQSHLRLRNELGVAVERLRFYSVWGELEKEVTTHFEQIQTDDLAVGLYLCEISLEDGRTVWIKVIKQLDH